MIAAAAALLTGCAASSFSGSDADGDTASSTPALKQAVRDGSTTTSASPDQSPQSLQPANTREARLTPGGTATDASPLRAPALAATAVATPNSAAYKIGPGDVLDITVFKVAELSKSAQVSETGTISYPLVGDVVAAGKTPREVEKDLTGTLGSRYLQKPQVSVYVKEFNSQRVTIEGAVKHPGVFPIQGSLSLLQAVALAQGMDATADDTVLVFRQTNGKRAAARFDISAIRTGDAEDPQLQAGDVIVAGTSALKEGWANIMKVLPIASVFTLI